MTDQTDEEIPLNPSVLEKVQPESSEPHDEVETREDDKLGCGIVRTGDTY